MSRGLFTTWALALWFALIGAGAAQDTDSNARQAVGNLQAYAAYKMGDYDKARATWQRLAATGNTTALINLANLYQQGQGVPVDPGRALGFIERAADLGDPRAQYELGTAFERGQHRPHDLAAAARWFRRAAQQDSGEAQFALGVLLLTGMGAGPDAASAAQRAEAQDWLSRAKANGVREAADYLALLAASPAEG